MDEQATASNGRDRQRAALVASLAIVVGFVIYWSKEIEAVREMLKLAYG